LESHTLDPVTGFGDESVPALDDNNGDEDDAEVAGVNVGKELKTKLNWLALENVQQIGKVHFCHKHLQKREI
jgi:hypothetical protein